MIIFYNRKSGQITGTIDGRAHTEDQLKMWLGDKAETERLVIEWKPVRFYDKEGNETEVEEEKWTSDFEPDHSQKDLIMKLESRELDIRTLKVDVETNTLLVEAKSML